MKKVGFIGLGNMGAAMAGRLVASGSQAGFEVVVWNRSPEAVRELESAGAVSAGSLDEVVETGMFFSMLANDAAARSVFSAQLISRAPAGSVHVNMGTMGIETADALDAIHAREGVAYVAAPVLGRPDVAAAGQLNIVASGDSAAIEAARPYLQFMGKRVWVVGSSPRAANVVKIAVNFNLVHAIQALAESLTLVEAAGIDSTAFVEILTDVAFTGSAYKGYGKLIAERDYRPAFGMALGAKDLGLAAQTAEAYGLSLPTVPALQRVFAEALASPDLAELDWSAVAEITRRQ